MKYLLYIIFVILLLSINVGFFSYFSIWGVVPNLLFLVVIIIALEGKAFGFFYVSVIAGLFLDFYSTSFVGSFTFAFLILSFSLHLLVRNVFMFEINWKYLSGIVLICLLLVNI